MSEEFDREYDEFLQALGRRIKEMRTHRRLSLRDMVVRHGYHDSQWRRYERGGSINVQSLLRIAKVFETSLSNLLDGLGAYPAVSVENIEKKISAEKNAARNKRATKAK